ncbi:GNAT family N-acetyltransferase [Oceanisphaera pacifica]|uniref:GNAT family N-acetyltransferase n=1 Tax=Oceanisphaera pacifica TaxID=2818389 RepID=A0ABS3NIJ3_9GAMM|nr:GNAT family N-acetyltransferase [Oceanisphaera pacifica]MBO1520387.1 GNAT family N-acetyltransferase [Oceanisphaera pacifica]
MPSNTISLQPLPPSDINTAARFCALAMADNPLHITVFGQAADKRQHRLTRLFSGLFPYINRNGDLIGAYADGQLVGVLGRLRPLCCRPHWRDMLRLMPTLLTSNSALGLLKTYSWLSNWAKLDPDTPHWHLGPLAVAPDQQRQGIGHSLMAYAINQAHGVSLYLETDKLSNVHFYQRLGFHITATPTLLDAQTWLMHRTHSDQPSDKFKNQAKERYRSKSSMTTKGDI